ncbi:MAG: glycosyltransferase [Flavimaricola sp.]|nr:glycosyltransferase [Flavimaricola sp.]
MNLMSLRNPLRVQRQLGFIDQVSNEGVSGWIKASTSDEPLTIDLYIDGDAVAQGVRADLFRADVRDAGIGNGCYGFQIFTPVVAKPGQSEVVIEARLSGGKKTLLSRSFLATELHSTEFFRISGAFASRESDYSGSIETLTPDRMRGWAVADFSASAVFDVDILIDGIFYARIRTDSGRDDLVKKGKSTGQGGFELEIPLRLLESGNHKVSVILPNGKSISRDIETVQTLRTRQGVFTELHTSQVAVIVPVYNAADDLCVCIERIAAYTPSDVEVIFIDDASPDAEVTTVLKKALDRPGNRVIKNDRNSGFSWTINRGIEEAGRKHVILLNSDARVTPFWVEGMLAAAGARPRVATVTPMSDRAGAFSAPDIGNENKLPAGVDEITYARAFRRRSLALYPLVPTGNGYCMFVSRDCIDAVGQFDAVAFPKGYGEENDFCMRAGREGWNHVIDDCTYVFHDRSKSFGETKAELSAAGRKIVDSRFSEYGTAIRMFHTSSDILTARFRARQALQDCGERQAHLESVLFVISTSSGGTPQTNADLMSALSDGIDCWLLRCDSRSMELSRVKDGNPVLMRKHILQEKVNPISHASAEYDTIIADWIRQIDFDFIHIRHIGWHSLSLPRIAQSMGKPVVFSFHDFYALCPTVKLVDHQGKYCGGNCTTGEGRCKVQLWPEDSLPSLKHNWVNVWRSKMAKSLEECDAFVTTSTSARDTILAQLPGIDPDRFVVIPHGRNFPKFARLRTFPNHAQPVKILVPGNIDVSKGLDIIYQLLDHDVSGVLEFHILGNVGPTGRAAHSRLTWHGSYSREDFLDKVASVLPQFGAIFSIWDETYCHTLTELWSAGVPALVFDFPTVAGRVRESGAGWVLPHGDVSELYDRIIALAFDREEQRRVDDAIEAWQEGEGRSNSTRMMAASYLDVYRDARNRRRTITHGHPISTHEHTPRIGVVGAGAVGNELDRAFASTEIRLWERTRNAIDRPIRYIRMTPETLLAAANDAKIDGALFQRNAIPKNLAPLLLGVLREKNIGYAFDMDDDLLNVPKDKDPTGQYTAYIPTLRNLLKSASLVTVSTDLLAEKIRSEAPTVIVWPNRISKRLWGGELPVRGKGKEVRALFMGTRTHGADFEIILPALEAAQRLYPRFSVTLIGVTSDGELPSWVERIKIPEGSYSRFVPWLRDLTPRADFALAPLDDTDFNTLKSSLKLLDYGALGLPVLASEVSVYRSVKDRPDNVTLVPNTTSAWEAAIVSQIQLVDTAHERGRKMREWVFENWAMEDATADFDATISKMIRSS